MLDPEAGEQLAHARERGLGAGGVRVGAGNRRVDAGELVGEFVLEGGVLLDDATRVVDEGAQELQRDLVVDCHFG
ncbi:hypothetical protein PUR29_35250 [Methylobacterium ajmalii]|uniref:Uncharacterized protein n=1 Tax=Methylobacterium ajmalii TaxID=2738439 RepID=A0ABV0A4D6_9HYPH